MQYLRPNRTDKLPETHMLSPITFPAILLLPLITIYVKINKRERMVFKMIFTFNFLNMLNIIMPISET